MVKVKGLEHHADKPFTFAIKQQQLFLSNTAAP
nr:MAG TPA: NEUROSERPIN, Serine protease inhibitor, Neuronal.06A [Caudoviricetes sp.]